MPNYLPSTRTAQTIGKTCMATFPCYHEATKGEAGKRAGTMNQVLKEESESNLFVCDEGRTRAKIAFRS